MTAEPRLTLELSPDAAALLIGSIQRSLRDIAEHSSESGVLEHGHDAFDAARSR